MSEDNGTTATEKQSREWTAIRDECVSSGALTIDCDIVAASRGIRSIEVVQQKLACGCILIPEDADEAIL